MTAAGGLLQGGASGLLWGIAARLWMRLISDEPEFSWGGTLLIVLGFMFFGALAGWTRVVRSGGEQGWRVVALRAAAFLAVVPLAMGAGALLVVGVVLPGALALGQRRWWPAGRLSLGLLAAAGTIGVSTVFVTERPLLLAPVSVSLFLLIAWVMVGWLRASLDPSPTSQATSTGYHFARQPQTR
jgi:hypothetical protein